MARPAILTPSAASGNPAAQAPAPADTGRSHQCPLCRHLFPADAIHCHDGCPLARRCHVICCPQCGYEFVDAEDLRNRLSRWKARLRRLLGRKP